jgi:hypothetical protein
MVRIMILYLPLGFMKDKGEFECEDLGLQILFNLKNKATAASIEQ